MFAIKDLIAHVISWVITEVEREVRIGDTEFLGSSADTLAVLKAGGRRRRAQR
jgi:hypothetical protein